MLPITEQRIGGLRRVLFSWAATWTFRTSAGRRVRRLSRSIKTGRNTLRQDRTKYSGFRCEVISLQTAGAHGEVSICRCRPPSAQMGSILDLIRRWLLTRVITFFTVTSLYSLATVTALMGPKWRLPDPPTAVKPIRP